MEMDRDMVYVQAHFCFRRHVPVSIHVHVTMCEFCNAQCCGSGPVLDRIRILPFSTDQTGSGSYLVKYKYRSISSLLNL
jgi:hypothetical protein